MGETGIGKTVLIEFLSEIMESKYYKINIHAGRTEKYIKEQMEKINDQARNEKEKLFLVFFDEINTN